ncbi:hypothetical protein [Amycolatopsis sp. GM8]|uniref:hypothetical protein n=1 Tax=Amycolatopsis sp. GM8 TaxID=2896530 RepID=UPI001F421DED|nr:hypothetical protein [Amycolatopsis sp. GM8]
MRSKDFADDPELAGPLATYLRARLEQRHEAESRFIGELPQWLDRWADKATFMDGRLSLTPDEAAELSAEVNALVNRYRLGTIRGNPARGADMVHFLMAETVVHAREAVLRRDCARHALDVLCGHLK